MSQNLTRRSFVATTSTALAAAAPDTLVIDPAPRYDLSPHLYMQFMEPLGATDSSVEAAWDHKTNQWREDVVAITAELGPTMMRWGGIFCDYYRWREGVGPRAKRPMMRNILWGGVESNQVGTAEFVDFSRRVGADPLICVNFESDGRDRYMHDGFSSRTAGAREAAEWVAYCNREDNAERRQHGFPAPLTVPYWQIGNETSYDQRGFRLEQAQTKTVEFAKAMRAEDPSIKLIGWGGIDRGSPRRGEQPQNWARGIAEAAGEHLNYLAFHHMFNPDDRDNPGLGFGQFRKDPGRTWELLMTAAKTHEKHIVDVRQRTDGVKIPLAMTECHFSVPGRNRCEVLSTWAAGVSYARMLHVQERHGDVLKIATAADFCGTRWQNNAVMIPVPGRAGSFLMPVAHIMKLYRHHIGEKAVKVNNGPGNLDVTASRTGNRLYLHVANTSRASRVTTRLQVTGMTVRGGTAYEIAVDPMLEIRQDNPDALAPVTKSVPASGEWTFPAASVSAVELELG
jgi:alpha-L-arabinofuranosidase